MKSTRSNGPLPSWSALTALPATVALDSVTAAKKALTAPPCAARPAQRLEVRAESRMPSVAGACAVPDTNTAPPLSEPQPDKREELSSRRIDGPLAAIAPPACRGAGGRDMKRGGMAQDPWRPLNAEARAGAKTSPVLPCSWRSGCQPRCSRPCWRPSSWLLVGGSLRQCLSWRHTGRRWSPRWWRRPGLRARPRSRRRRTRRSEWRRRRRVGQRRGSRRRRRKTGRP